jgi:hypothetical protein
VRVDGDAEHFAADTAIEAFDHAIRLRCAGLGVPIGRSGSVRPRARRWFDLGGEVGRA